MIAIVLFVVGFIIFVLIFIGVIFLLLKYFLKEIKDLQELSNQNSMSYLQEVNRANAWWSDITKNLYEKLCSLNEEWSDQFALTNIEWANELKSSVKFYENEIDEIITGPPTPEELDDLEDKNKN